MNPNITKWRLSGESHRIDTYIIHKHLTDTHAQSNDLIGFKEVKVPKYGA
jgi:hypothetical protein